MLATLSVRSFLRDCVRCNYRFLAMFFTFSLNVLYRVVSFQQIQTVSLTIYFLCYNSYYSARAMFSKAIAKAKANRNHGVRLIQRQKRLSTDTSITRGPLKKKDYHGSTEVTKMWRNRYFVIDHKKGELRYYDNRYVQNKKLCFTNLWRDCQWISLISTTFYNRIDCNCCYNSFFDLLWMFFKTLFKTIFKQKY